MPAIASGTLIVIALGGNALLRRGQPPDAERQRANVRLAAQSIAELAPEHRLVVSHGNGPQIGLLALQAEASPERQGFPLDVLGAETEGMIGYVIEQELASLLPSCPVATLLTQVEVDPDDPAFTHPSKPIGPLYSREQARALADARGWSIARDGTGYRRVVASPFPKRILELSTIALLVAAGVLVICAGGGGIPVIITPTRQIRGVEAVIDKDRSAALLAAGLGAELLVMLSDVGAVYADWPTPARRPIRYTTPAELAELHFDAGSMGPKVESACRFVETTGRRAAIGALADAAAIVRGDAGTIIAPRR